MRIRNRLLRYTLTSLWYVFAVSMVMLALVVSIARMLTPVLSEQRDDIERWISQYSDQNIRISSMEAQWRGFSPRIVLKDVQLLDKRAVRTVVRFQEAQIGISIYESLKEKQLVPNSLKVIGVNIAFTRRLDGSLNIRGIAETNTKEAQQYSEILAQWLLRQKQLGIEKGDIYWNDEITGVKNMHFSNVALTIRNSETRHQFEGSVDLPKNLGSRLNFAADLQGNLLNPLDWQASLYIGGKQFQFAQWLGGSSLGNVSVQDGISDFQLWGEWQKGNLSRIEGKFATKNIKMTINSLQQSIAYTSARGAALWTREDTGWTLRVRDLDLQKGSQRWDNNDFYITSSRDGNQIDADFKFLPVKEVTSLLLASQLLDSDVDKILKTSQPEGELSDVKLHFAKDAKIENRLKFEARFEDLALNAWDVFPAMSGLTGEIKTSLVGGELILDSQNVSIDYDRYFDQNTPLEKIKSRIVWAKQPHGWEVSSDYLDLSNQGVTLKSIFILSLPEDHSAPYLNLVSKFVSKDGRVALKYMPTKIMEPEVVDWLDTAIIGGQVPSGGVIIRGRLDKFPFDSGDGKFEARFSLKNAELNYIQGWPHITGIDAEIVFLGRSLSISASAGRILESDVVHADVAIADMAAEEPVLTVNGTMQGFVKDALQYLRVTGVADSYGDSFKQLYAQGRSSLELDLKVPLGESEVTVNGKMNFHNSVFGIKDVGLELNHVSGSLLFNEVNVSAKGIKGEVLGKAFDIDLKPADRGANGSKALRLTAMTDVDTGLLSRLSGVNLGRILDGKTLARVIVDIPVRSKSKRTDLHIESDMKGMSVSLPSPLGKTADMVRPLVISSSLVDFRPGSVSVDYANIFKSQLELTQRDGKYTLQRGVISFGEDVPKMTHQQGIVVSGKLKSLVVNDWLSLLSDSKRTQQQGQAPDQTLSYINSLNLDAEQLVVNQRILTDVKLAVARVDDGFQIDVNASQARGKILLPADLNTRPVVANFDYLAYTPLEEPYQSEADPRNWPALRLNIADFKYAGYSVGKVDATVNKTPDGLFINKLDIQSPLFQVTGSGDWLYQDGKSITRLSMDVHADDIGKALSAFDYADTISGGSTDSSMQLSWPDAPDGFTLSKLSGKLKLDIKNGRILEFKSGAGRIFGLLSLQTLPRRLLLDFSDLFAKGFSFDVITGRFDIDNGDAFTPGLLMDGPSAQINISGRTGLINKDYDQLVTVVPHVTASLPVAGALVGGPIAGGLLYAFDKLFKKQINKITQIQYTITGSWDQPVVKLLQEQTPKKDNDADEG